MGACARLCVPVFVKKKKKGMRIKYLKARKKHAWSDNTLRE